VTFKDGSTILVSVALSGGSAIYTTSSLSVGSHTITATYNGGINYTSSSGSTTQTVSQDSTITVVSAAPSSSVFGQTVTFTATVTANVPGSGTPGGSVTFKDGTTILASVALSSGSASYSTASLGVGSHSITATYNGGINYTSSSGSTTQTVSQDSTTTTVSASPTSSVYGQSVSFTATVIANAPGSGTPKGTVTFRDGSTILASINLSGGSATYTTSLLAVGSHTITATYNGGVNYTASSGSTSETVSQDSTTTTVKASPSSPQLGHKVTFTATVSANAPGSGTPAGTVTFQDGAAILATVALSKGSASYSTSSLSAGSHTITATYNGGVNYTPSSGSVTITVNGAAPATAQLAPPNSTSGLWSAPTNASGSGLQATVLPQLPQASPAASGTFTTLAPTAVPISGSPSTPSVSSGMGASAGLTLPATNLATFSYAGHISDEAGEGWGTIVGRRENRSLTVVDRQTGEDAEEE
jgi:hypothetical protein